MTHLARLEKLQHRFLMWLGAKTHERCSMDYAALSRHFLCPSIKARLVQSDVRFVWSVFGGRLDCNYLVAKFALLVPGRRSRHTGVLNVHTIRSRGRNEKKLYAIYAIYTRIYTRPKTSE